MLSPSARSSLLITGSMFCNRFAKSSFAYAVFVSLLSKEQKGNVRSLVPRTVTAFHILTHIPQLLTKPSLYFPRIMDVVFESAPDTIQLFFELANLCGVHAAVHHLGLLGYQCLSWREDRWFRTNEKMLAIQVVSDGFRMQEDVDARVGGHRWENI